MHYGHGYRAHKVHVQNEKVLWGGGKELLKRQCANPFYYSNLKIIIPLCLWISQNSFLAAELSTGHLSISPFLLSHCLLLPCLVKKK